jgi:hypothetical protein
MKIIFEGIYAIQHLSNFDKNIKAQICFGQPRKLCRAEQG